MPRLIGIFSGCASHFVGFNVLWLNQNRHTFYDKHQAYMGHVMRKPVYAICELKGVDQPVHARRLIRTFVVRYLDSIPLVSISENSRLYLASVVAQAKTGFLVTRFIWDNQSYCSATSSRHDTKPLAWSCFLKCLKSLNVG